jgi:5-methyltetrahydropteroyltriglutamate--homocysteine methyltransferase
MSPNRSKGLVEAHLSGAFPRSEKLVAATRALERRKGTQDEVENALKQDNLSLANLQNDVALDFIVDGQLNWQDLFRPFSKLFSGIEPASLTRWFDNNTFYRAPLVKGKISFTGNDTSKFFRVDASSAIGRKKAILPGPFTFAALSEEPSSSSRPDLVDQFAHALRDLIKNLQGVGYKCFQFNEPSLCEKSLTKDDFTLAKNGIETCAKGLDGQSVLHTYFGDSSKVIESLLDYSVDSIGIDFYATSLDSLMDLDFNKGLGCGCIDGRNSLLESPNETKEFVSKTRELLQPKSLIIIPNCDLDFLPQPIAEKKVRLLAQIRKLV